MKEYTFIPEKSDSKLRIDKYISEQLEDISRSYIQKLLKDGLVFVNNSACKANYQVKENDIISFSVPENTEPEIEPEDISLDIIYEDSDIIVVNKPKGMVVHPAAGHTCGTLVNALMHHCKDLSGINGVLRPGIVHRIDKDTTGVLVACKNDFAHKALAEQLKAHSINRVYSAIVQGTFKESEGTVRGAIGRKPSDRKLMAINERNGKNAVTHYKVIETLRNSSYIECRLETGRTHQIRVHMASIHHPVLGDEIYGGKNAAYKLNGEFLQGQTLHARILGFIHPRTNEYMEFEAPLPDYFVELLDKLKVI